MMEHISSWPRKGGRSRKQEEWGSKISAVCSLSVRPLFPGNKISGNYLGHKGTQLKDLFPNTPRSPMGLCAIKLWSLRYLYVGEDFQKKLLLPSSSFFLPASWKRTRGLMPQQLSTSTKRPWGGEPGLERSKVPDDMELMYWSSTANLWVFPRRK